MAELKASDSSLKSQPVSVLFVCLGNICRSTMAEGVFRSLTAHPSHPLISEIDSAGTAAYHTGSPPDPRTTRVLKKNGITDYKHSARKVHPNDFKTFDYIFAMDPDNLYDLKNMRSKRGKAGSQNADEKEAKIMLFGDWGGKKGEEVLDPYYGADDGFDIAYEQMVRFSNGFLKHLDEEAKKAEN